MTSQKQQKKKQQPKRPKDSEIVVPKKDIKVEPGQPTFLPSLKKMIKKKS